jgi:hypothetical protein
MSNSLRNLSKHRQSSANRSSLSRAQASGFGRGGAAGSISRFATSELERVTLTGPSSETTVESYAKSPPTVTTTDFDDDDSLEQRLQQSIDELSAEGEQVQPSLASTIRNPYRKSPPNSVPPLDSQPTSVLPATNMVTDSQSQPHSTLTNHPTPMDTSTNMDVEATPTLAPDILPMATEVEEPLAPALQLPTVMEDVVATGTASPLMNNDNTEYVPPRVRRPTRTEFIQENEWLYDPDADEDAQYNGPNAHPKVAPSPERHTTGRYTWKVHALPSDNSFASLKAAILELWEVFLASDPSFVIYPWTESVNDPTKALTSTNQCPSITRDLLAYFHKGYPRSSGGSYYIGVRMGYQLSYADMKTATAEFFSTSVNKTRVGYWYRPLQHDKPVEIGWLLGSTPSMSLERLTAEIYTRSNGKVEIGCRWKAIAMKTYIPDMPDHLRFKAIHIEVKAEQQSAATRFFGALFSKSRTKNFVMNTTLRFIPLISAVTKHADVVKVSHCRDRQGIFLHQLKQSYTFHVQSLDFKSHRLGNQSLRDLIMKLRVDSPTSKQLFHSCDLMLDGSVSLTFLGKHESIGFQKSHNLLAYLRFTNPPEYHDAITECFMDSAYADADDAVWDPQNHTVLTSVDVIISDIEEGKEDDAFGYSPELDKVVVEVDKTQLDNVSTASSNPRRNLDDDSITTFRSAYKKTRFSESTKPPAQDNLPVTRPQRTTTRPPRTPTDDISTHSELTTDSRLSALEAQSVTNNTYFAKIFTILQRVEQNQLASAQSQENSGAGCPP